MWYQKCILQPFEIIFHQCVQMGQQFLYSVKAVVKNIPAWSPSWHVKDFKSVLMCHTCCTLARYGHMQPFKQVFGVHFDTGVTVLQFLLPNLAYDSAALGRTQQPHHSRPRLFLYRLREQKLSTPNWTIPHVSSTSSASYGNCSSIRSALKTRNCAETAEKRPKSRPLTLFVKLSKVQ